MVEGSCLCGSIKYEVELMPDKIFNCHCKFCRKVLGADYVTLALAKASTLTLMDADGTLKEHENDLGGFRSFCSNCGARLRNYAPDKGLYLSVTMSTIDTLTDLKPVAHVNTESKASWCEPYIGIPSFKGLPEGVL